MKAEKPARGTMKTGEWPDVVSFRTECDCSDPDHAVATWIEVKGDAEVRHVDLTFYVNTQTPVWDRSRWRAIWNLLTKGYHQGQHTLLLDSQSAVNLAAAIQDSVEQLEQKPNKKTKR